MAGYTRQSSFVDGDTITAALFNDEYNQLVNVFSNTSGHKHDGTAAEGPVIGLIGDAGETSPNNKVLIDTTNNYIEFYVEVSSAPVQQLYIADGAIVPVTDSDIDLGTTSLRFKDTYTDTVTTTGNVSIGGNLTVTGNATISGNLTFGDADTDSINLAAEIDSDIIPNTDGTYDLGSSTKEWQDLYIDGTANIDSLVADTADINAGTIDNTAIGSTTASSGAFTTITASGAATFNGNVTLGDAATDNVVFNADVNSSIIPNTDDTYDLGSVTQEWRNLYVDGTANVDTLVIGTSTGVTSVDTDLTSVSASDDTLASAKAIKTYIDAQVTAQDLDFQGDTGGALSIDLDSETLTIAGGTGIDTVGATNTLTVSIDSTVATLTDTQTLTNKTLTTPVISSISNTGTLTLPTSTDTLVGRATTDTLTNKTISGASNTLSNIGNSSLTNSTVSYGGVSVSLGASDATPAFNLSDATAYPGDSSLVTVGTIASGTWQGTAIADTYVANDLTISGGTVNNTVIGGTTPAAGTFTTLTANTSITGTLATAAQPNITSVGTLSSLTTSGNVTVGGNLTVNGTTTTVNSTTVTIDDPVFTLGGDTAPSVDDNKDRGIEFRWHNGTTAKVGFFGYDDSASVFTFIPDATNTAEVFSGSAGNVAFGNIAGTLTTAAQTNITSVGTLSSLTVSGDLTVDTSTLYVDSTNNRVGIGTTSPSNILKVFNTANSDGVNVENTNASFTESGLFVNNTASTGGNLLRLRSSGSDKVVVLGTGNVGIGTSSPDGKLDIQTSANESGILLDAISAGNDVGLTFNRWTGTASNYHQWRVGEEVDDLTFGYVQGAKGSTPSEKMRINQAGNVGINTTNPQGKLSISDGSLSMITMSSNGTKAFIQTQKWGGEFNGRDLAFNTQDSAGESMRIDSSGNVGIGTSSPTDYGATANTLEVKGASGSGSGLIKVTGADGVVSGALYASGSSTMVLNTQTNHALSFNTNNTERMRIDSSGNVGIGSTSPTELLTLRNADPTLLIQGNQVSGVHYSDIDFKNQAGSVLGTIGLSYYGGPAEFYRNVPTSWSHVWKVNSSEKMRLDSSGNVGIGTTSPSSTLHLNNSNPSLRWSDSDGVNQFTTMDQSGGTFSFITRNGPSAGSYSFKVQDSSSTNVVMTVGNQIAVEKSAYIKQVAITSSSGSVAWDTQAAANAYYATTENTTFAAPTNAVEGAIITVEIAQGATAYTVAWNTVFEFAASTAPTVTATANKTDIFTFRYNGSVWQEIGRTQNLAQT